MPVVRRVRVCWLLWVPVIWGGGAPLSSARAESVRFSHARGVYDAPFRLTLETDLEGAAIRYTLDGSLPSRTHGAVYEQPLSISTTTVVRAFAHSDAADSGSVATHTYLFLDHVVDQPRYPEGYIRQALSEKQGMMQSFDYEMDPDVVGDGPRRAEFGSYLKANPCLSLVLDRDEFNAIYANHRGRGAAWERRASVELLYPGGGRFADFRGFQADCGLRMQGGLAVDQARKKSFRLLFKKIYGSGKLRYPLFESAVHHARTATRRFDTVVLRAGGNTNWSKDDAYKHEPSTYLRDQFVRDSSISMAGLGARGIFVHLFVNGLYFGLYNVTERPDAKFMASYLGGDEEDYHSVNHHGTVGGDPARWNELMSAVQRAAFGLRGLRALRALRGRNGSSPSGDDRVLEESLDFANFADYIILHWFCGTGDWPYNNWYAGARNRPAGRYLFFSWDAELSFWTANGYHYSNPGAWVNPYFLQWSTPIPLLWRALATSDDFRMTFADRAYRHCENGGALSDGRVKARFRRLADSIEQAIVAESARWGDAARGNESSPHTREKDWYPNRDAVLTLMEGNDTRFLAALRAQGLYPSLDPPVMPRRWPPLKRGSPVKAGFVLTLRNPNRAGRVVYTLDGSDPRTQGSGAVSPRAREYDASAPPRLRETTRVKSRVVRGSEWSALGDVLYLVGHATLPLRISELMYRPRDGEALEFVEIENVSSAPVEVTGLSMEGIDYHFPPGRELSGGQVLVLVPNDDPDAFRARYPGVDIFGTYRGHLANSGERITVVTSEEEVIASVSYGSGAGWPASAAGGGHSLELVDPSRGGERPQDWRASPKEGGTPGTVRAGADQPGE